MHGYGFGARHTALDGFVASGYVPPPTPPPTDIHPGFITKTRSLRIVPHDHTAFDDDDLQDILTMVTHLWL